MKKSFREYMQMTPQQLGAEFVKIRRAQEEYTDKYGILGCPDYGLENLLNACANLKIDPRKQQN